MLDFAKEMEELMKLLEEAEEEGIDMNRERNLMETRRGLLRGGFEEVQPKLVTPQVMPKAKNPEFVKVGPYRP